MKSLNWLLFDKNQAGSQSAMRAIRYEASSPKATCSFINIRSQSAMRAIRYEAYEIATEESISYGESQSAMRAIRYEEQQQKPVDVKPVNVKVAIRYACNKI